jgi:hypothetical protein
VTLLPGHNASDPVETRCRSPVRMRVSVLNDALRCDVAPLPTDHAAPVCSPARSHGESPPRPPADDDVDVGRRRHSDGWSRVFRHPTPPGPLRRVHCPLIPVPAPVVQSDLQCREAGEAPGVHSRAAGPKPRCWLAPPSLFAAPGAVLTVVGAPPHRRCRCSSGQTPR